MRFEQPSRIPSGLFAPNSSPFASSSSCLLAAKALADRVIIETRGTIHAVTLGLDRSQWVTLTGRRWNGARLGISTTNGGVNLDVPNDYSAEVEAGTTNGWVIYRLNALDRRSQRPQRRLRTMVSDGARDDDQRWRVHPPRGVSLAPEAEKFSQGRAMP